MNEKKNYYQPKKVNLLQQGIITDLITQFGFPCVAATVAKRIKAACLEAGLDAPSSTMIGDFIRLAYGAEYRLTPSWFTTPSKRKAGVIMFNTDDEAETIEGWESK